MTVSFLGGIYKELAPVPLTPSVNRRRTGQSLRRVRILASLLALVVLVSIPMDLYLAPPESLAPLLGVRALSVAAFLGIAYAALKLHGERTAYLLTANLFMVALAGFLGGLHWLGAADSGAQVATLYYLPVILLIATTAAFPLTLPEGIALQSPLHVGALAGAALLDNAFSTPLFVLAAGVGMLALWFQHIYLRTLVYYVQHLPLEPLALPRSGRPLQTGSIQCSTCHSEACCVLVVDVDPPFFSPSLGTHDKLIREVSSHLQGLVRTQDRVSPQYISGERRQRILILAETTREGGRELGRRLNAELSKRAATSHNRNAYLTLWTGRLKTGDPSGVGHCPANDGDSFELVDTEVVGTTRFPVALSAG